MRIHPASFFVPLSLLAVAATILVASCQSPGRATVLPTSDNAIGTNAYRDRVMTSAFCGTCHPDIYAEHAMNTHGRAFTDPEVRLATGDFEHGDCIRCHTPRPVFETGIGLNPQRRYYGLEEGNTCMTCHWREGVDYANFTGGGVDTPCPASLPKIGSPGSFSCGSSDTVVMRESGTFNYRGINGIAWTLSGSTLTLDLGSFGVLTADVIRESDTRLRVRQISRVKDGVRNTDEDGCELVIEEGIPS